MSNPNRFRAPDVNTPEMRIARRVLAVIAREEASVRCLGSAQIAEIVREEMLKSAFLRALGRGHFADISRLEWTAGILSDLRRVLYGEIEPAEMLSDVEASLTALGEAEEMVAMLKAELLRWKGQEAQNE